MSKALELSNKYKTLLDKYEINTPKRLAMFFAQLDHESNLKPIAENLNYSADGLMKTFGKYFTTATAKEYARNQQMIANKVYANRMGNGSEASGDGWDYRGRGFIQLTGLSNYKDLTKDTGINFIDNPDLLLQEANAMIGALWFWKKNRINRFSDVGDVIGATKVINGGTNGLVDRQNKYKKYNSIFK